MKPPCKNLLCVKYDHKGVAMDTNKIKTTNT